MSGNTDRRAGRNNMDKFAIAAAIGLAMALAPARAAELKVIAGGSMTASLEEIGPQFEKASGHKLDMTFAATPELIKMATSGPFRSRGGAGGRDEERRRAVEVCGYAEDHCACRLRRRGESWRTQARRKHARGA